MVVQIPDPFRLQKQRITTLMLFWSGWFRRAMGFMCLCFLSREEQEDYEFLVNRLTYGCKPVKIDVLVNIPGQRNRQ